MLSPELQPSAPPSSFKEYTVKLPYGLSFRELLGAGISGVVVRLDAVVKHFDEDRQDHLSRELTIYQRLEEQHYDHPRFLRLYGTIGNCLILGYAANGTLRDYIEHQQQSRPTPLSLRLRWIEQILDAVVVLHPLSIIHGDLSCNNFLFDEDLNIKVGDFAGSSIDGKRGFTAYEIRCSHPQLEDVTCESEVFALGSCLYEIMAGRKPHSELSDMEVEVAYSKGEFPDVMSLEACRHFIRKCWAREYHDLVEILQEVRAEIQDMPPYFLSVCGFTETHPRSHRASHSTRRLVRHAFAEARSGASAVAHSRLEVPKMISHA